MRDTVVGTVSLKQASLLNRLGVINSTIMYYNLLNAKLLINVKMTFLVRNKLECLSLANLSSLV